MSVLIATLGTEPQVITTALDLLMRRGESIEEVVVLHTIAPGSAIADAVETLHEAFARPPYARHTMLTLCPLTDRHGKPLTDVKTLEDTQHAFRTLFHSMQRVKQAGKNLHVCLAGGRKNLAIFGMVAAQMLFDEADRLWHLYSGGPFLAAKRMHPAQYDDAHLIAIPVVLWSQLSPALLALEGIDDPFQALERIRHLRLREKTELARTFVLGSLSAAERRVTGRLVREGLSDYELAAQLHLSPRTVEQHLRSAYAKAAIHWEMEHINRAQLIALLNLYYSTELREIPHDERGLI